jgi:hypothetical protein
MTERRAGEPSVYSKLLRIMVRAEQHVTQAERRRQGFQEVCRPLRRDGQETPLWLPEQRALGFADALRRLGSGFRGNEAV